MSVVTREFKFSVAVWFIPVYLQLQGKKCMLDTWSWVGGALSVHMEQPSLCWMDFHESFYWVFFTKDNQKIHVWLILHKN